jgi:hypothetical protein
MFSIGCTALGLLMTQIPALAGINIPDFFTRWSANNHAVNYAEEHAMGFLHRGAEHLPLDLQASLGIHHHGS